MNDQRANEPQFTEDAAAPIPAAEDTLPGPEASTLQAEAPGSPTERAFTTPVPTAPRKPFNPLLAGAIGFVAGALVAGGAFAIAQGSSERREAEVAAAAAAAAEVEASAAAAARLKIFEGATAACNSPIGIYVQDGGRTLEFNMKGQDESYGASYSSIDCIFTELALPSRIDTHIGQTTSMDGRQSAEWDGFEIQWSYHPDRGLDGLIILLDD